MMISRQPAQEGQIVVITLLVMAVTLTLGLAASRQVTTDLKVSRQQADSAKAYSAAESGLEKALAGYAVGQTTLEEGYVSAVVDQQEIGNNPEVVWPSVVRSGEGMFFWLAGHDTNGAIDYANGIYGGTTVTVCWKRADSAGADPAVVAALFYEQGSKVKYQALDADAARRGNNGFSSPAGNPTTDCPSGFDQAQDISVLGLANPVFIWVRSFYADAQLGFKGDANLPIQGYVYTSTGTAAPTDAPEVISRRIRAFKGFKQPDPVLLEPLTSFGSITASMP